MYDIIAYMISDMISYMPLISYNDIHELDMISCIKMHFSYFSCPAVADSRPAQRAHEIDDDSEPDRPMDFDKERDHADQGPFTDMDMEENSEILSLLLKHMPSDIKQLVRDIPVQPPVVVVPVRRL